MRVAVHQPHYLPWLGYMAKVAACDVFVVNDMVQYCRRDYQNRNRILADGRGVWLTAPVHLPHGFRTDLADVKMVCDRKRPWWRAHAARLEMSYRNTAYWPCVGAELLAMVERAGQFERLVDVAEETFRVLAPLSVQKMPLVVQARDLLSVWPDEPNEGNLALVRAVGGDTYVSGEGGLSYMDRQLWARSGVDVVFTQFVAPRYDQGGTEGHVPYMCVVDALANCGPDAVQAMVREGLTETDWWEPVERAETRLA